MTFFPKAIKVNLIPYNGIDVFAHKAVTEKQAKEFLLQLRRYGLKATLRQKKGTDIDAACGQLRLKQNKS